MIYFVYILECQKNVMLAATYVQKKNFLAYQPYGKKTFLAPILSPFVPFCCLLLSQKEMEGISLGYPALLAN